MGGTEKQQTEERSKNGESNMTAWVVRGGVNGEHEQWNVDHGCTTIAWSEIGDLTRCSSREDVRRLVEAEYAEDNAPYRIANYTGQLWAFRDSIEIGDLIVMPLKSNAGYIQFGHVTGDYTYLASEPIKDRRHARTVTWNPEPVPKTVFGEDLLLSLNALMTVFKPSKNDAANRLAVIAANGKDPGAPEGVGGPSPSADFAAKDVTDPVAVPTLESIQDRVRAHVSESFREHELTRLVADILTALGFQCEISPPGPDGGVDIIAGTGPLGLGSPTVIVEVKSERTPIDVKVLRGLHSAMTQHKADHALLVAWGGVTKPARKEFQRDRTSLRIWDADDLLEKLFETYDRLPRNTRDRIPLQQVWVLDKES